jgi:hypothetical protein
MQDQKRMFGESPDNLQAYLGRVIQESWRDSNCNMDETYTRARRELDNYRPFDSWDKNRVIERAREVASCGGKMDWSDPYLRPNGSRRPLSDRGY